MCYFDYFPRSFYTGIIFKYKEDISAKTTVPITQRDEEVPNLYHISSDCACGEYIKPAEVDNVYVFAQQGKSVRTHLWPLDQLLRSNSQLNELDPLIAEHMEEYVIPAGGVSAGLKNKVVCLQRVNSVS